MIELGGKRLCESCFEEITSQPCPHCGFDPAVPSADPTILAPGSVLLGKYIVGRVIGKGGFGITYLAYDTTLGKKAAIKEFYPYGIALRTVGNPTVTVSTSENASVFKTGAEKFYEEAKLVSRFNGNPNIVAVHEFFYENDTVYFSMEYLSGHTLKDHIQNIGTLNAGQALFIAQNVSNALMVAHSASVLHRDISPDNIMLCDNGEVKLIDFGAARQVLAERSQTFSVILKPGFAPLEQYQKKGKQGAWTDIYSLGATLYYALTEDIPDDPMSRQEEDETFSENKYNINEELWNVIRKATMLKIPDRYQDVFELRKALNQVSFPAELIAAPQTRDNVPQEGFRTAMPFGTSTATMQRAQNITAEVSVSTPQTAPEKNPGFFAAHKKPIIAAASAAGTAAIAAVILAVALNSGGQSTDGYVQLYNSTTSSISESSSKPVTTPEPTTTTPKPATTASEPVTTTPKTTTTPNPTTTTPKPVTTTPKPVTTTPKPATTTPKPVSTTPKPATTTPKPATTKPVTTTTTAMPAVSEPEEVKTVMIGGESYSTDLTELSLVYKGLKDSDVKDLKYMKNLTYLDLSFNDLTDISFVKEMPNLEYLDFGINNVSDISALKGLSKLKELHFDRNNVSDISALNGLSKLEKLVFSGNNVSDISALNGLSKLEILYFDGNNVSDISAVKGLSKLKELYFADNNVSDISVLKDLSELKKLDFDDNNVSDISALKRLSKLEQIDGSGNSISDIFSLAGKKKLTGIWLNDNMISDVSPLKDCESIFVLNLEYNCISENSIDSFAGLTVNGPLFLSGNGLTQAQVDRIAAKINGSPSISF